MLFNEAKILTLNFKLVQIGEEMFSIQKVVRLVVGY